MTTLLFSLALIVLIVVSFVMAMNIKYLYEEIDRLENIFDYHKRIHNYERLVVEQKIKEFIQLLDQLKESLSKEEDE